MKLLLENPYLSVYFALVAILTVLFAASFRFPGLVRFQKGLGLALAAVPVVYFFLMLDAHLVNIPFTDDFNLLETVHNFYQAQGFVAKMEVLFEQVNQHRFAFERIVMLIMVLFTGTVNIKAQIILGNLALLGISYLLFKSLRKESISGYYFIPVIYLIFNLVYWENAYWGIAALQNTPLIFFALLTAYFIGRGDQKSLYWGILAALITTFTSGSGLLAWIIGGLILGFQKRFKILGIWIAVAAAIILFYFLFDYNVIPSNGEKPWAHPVFNFIFVLGFWGNAFFLDVRHPLVPQFHPDLIACVLLGGAIFLIFLIWFGRIVLRKKQVWSDWFLWGAMMFSMGTGAMFVISRPIANHFMYGGNVFSRRYMIFGVVLLAAAYVCLVILVKNQKRLRNALLVVGLLGFIGLNFTSYFLSTVQIRKMREDLVIDSYYWQNYTTFITAGDKFGDIPFWNHPTRMKELVNAVETGGLTNFYQYNTFPPAKQLIAATADKNAAYPGSFNATFHYRNTDNNISTRYYRFTATSAGEEPVPAYIVLHSGSHTILLPAIPVPNSLPEFLTTGRYYSSKYQYSLFETKLPHGVFSAWLLFPDQERDVKWKAQFTGKNVLIR